MDLPIILVLGVIAAIIWVLVALRSRRIQTKPEPFIPKNLNLYSVACVQTAWVQQYPAYLDTSTRLRVYAVRAYSQPEAEEMVRKDIGDTGDTLCQIVSIEMPRDWLYTQGEYHGNTASPPLPSPSA